MLMLCSSDPEVIPSVFLREIYFGCNIDLIIFGVK
jgi:hypothetical protein